MRPINSFSFSISGDNTNRIGPAKRTTPYSEFDKIEKAIIEHCPLPASADISPCQPPFFTEFTYADVLGGMNVQTFSAEVNARLISGLDNFVSNDFPSWSIQFMDGIKDKYISKSDEFQYKKIAFLPGHNIFDRMVDSQKLFELMDRHQDLMIKPHPITQDALLRNLGQQFGYGRIIPKEVSAQSLLKNCQDVYSTSNSEISLLAILFGKNFYDLTTYMQNWNGYPSPFLYTTLNQGGTKQRLLELILHPESGFVFPWMDAETIKYRIHKYTNKALEIRENFRMVTSQRLIVQMPRVMEPPKQPTAPTPS